MLRPYWELLAGAVPSTRAWWWVREVASGLSLSQAPCGGAPQQLIFTAAMALCVLTLDRASVDHKASFKTFELYRFFVNRYHFGGCDSADPRDSLLLIVTLVCNPLLFRVSWTQQVACNQQYMTKMIGWHLGNKVMRHRNFCLANGGLHLRSPLLPLMRGSVEKLWGKGLSASSSQRSARN